MKAWWLLCFAEAGPSARNDGKSSQTKGRHQYSSSNSKAYFPTSSTRYGSTPPLSGILPTLFHLLPTKAFLAEKEFIQIVVFTLVTLLVALYFYISHRSRSRSSSSHQEETDYQRTRHGIRGGGEGGGPAEIDTSSTTMEERSRLLMRAAAIKSGSRNSSKPIISVGLNNVLFQLLYPFTSSDNLSTHDAAAAAAAPPAPTPHATTNRSFVLSVLPESVEPFRELCYAAELYVFIQVRSDEEESLVNEALFDMGVVGPNMLKPHRILYSSTVKGRASMVRQLMPVTHVDCEDDVVQALTGKVPNIVKLRGADQPGQDSNLHHQSGGKTNTSGLSGVQDLKSFVELFKEMGLPS